MQPFGRFRPFGRARIGIPAACASSFTASMKGRPRWSVIHRIASPCAPQPKQ